MTDTPTDGPSLRPLIELITRLRAPDGCPWDREQTLASLRKGLLEEAHELAAAIDDGEPAAVREELGDVLFQATFIGHLLEQGDGGSLSEGGALSDAIAQVHSKMVERHPHVFDPDGVRLDDPQAVAAAWQRRKVEADKDRSVLAGVSSSLPSLVAALLLTEKAAGVGFDWPDRVQVLAKVKEELAEVEQAMGITPGEAVLEGDLEEAEAVKQAQTEEIGDLLLAVANLARHLEIDPEMALAQANRKFKRRFADVEESLRRSGRSLASADLAEMDRAWDEAKRAERRGLGAMVAERSSP